jgi:hypothetical protein
MRYWLFPALKAFVLASLAALLTLIGPHTAATDAAAGGAPGSAAITAAGAPTPAASAAAEAEAVVVLRAGMVAARLVRAGPAGPAAAGAAGATAVAPWRLVAPIDAPADPEAAAALAERIAIAAIAPLDTRDDSPAPDDAALGLGAPRLEVRLEGAGGVVLRTLRFGARNPYDGSVWAREGAGPPGRVSGMTFAALDLDALALRERRALPFRPELVREVEVDGPGGARALRVTRTLDSWKLEGAGDAGAGRADPELVEAWLAALCTMRFRAWVGAAPVAPTAAAHTITVRLQSGGELALRWDGGPLAIRAVPDEPTARVDVPAQLLEDLLRRPRDLSDHRLVTFTRAAVTRVKVIGDERFVVFEKIAPGSWELRAPTTRPVPLGVVDALLHSLARVRAEEAAPPTPGAGKRPPPGPPAPAPVVAGRTQPGGEPGVSPGPSSAPAANPRVVELYDADARLVARLQLTPGARGWLARAGDSEHRVDATAVGALGLEGLLALGR